MKELKKDDVGLFICEECNKTFIKKEGLSYHINKKHNGQKIYFDKWIKEESDGKCIICNCDTKFNNFYGYDNCCSKKCTNEYRIKKIQKTLLKIYGVDCPAKNESIRNKINQTSINRYGNACPAQGNELKKQIKEKNIENLGVEYPFQSKYIQEKIIKSNIEKYGVKNSFQRNDVKSKIKKILFEKYGVDSPIKNKDIKNKIKKTCIKKYNVENPAQDTDIFFKTQKSGYRCKQYKNTSIYYRGSYELDFLENFYDRYSDIKNASSVRYIFNGKNKIYFPDYFIPSLNLIVECKNSYLYKKDIDKIEAKQKAIIENGFKYCIIIDKNYPSISNILPL